THCGIAARIAFSIHGDIKRGKGNEGQQEMERTVHSCGDLQWWPRCTYVFNIPHKIPSRPAQGMEASPKIILTNVLHSTAESI
ncbi:hypothetical protein PILCRDRAFT_830157, partial [Piloderma croceum F 1598]